MIKSKSKTSELKVEVNLQHPELMHSQLNENIVVSSLTIAQSDDKVLEQEKGDINQNLNKFQSEDGRQNK